MTDVVTRSIIERGDLAHLALFLWAVGASLIIRLLLRELGAANRRFADFVQELGELNRHLNQLVKSP